MFLLLSSPIGDLGVGLGGSWLRRVEAVRVAQAAPPFRQVSGRYAAGGWDRSPKSMVVQNAILIK
jgi:hypothetical protein